MLNILINCRVFKNLFPHLKKRKKNRIKINFKRSNLALLLRANSCPMIRVSFTTVNNRSIPAPLVVEVQELVLKITSIIGYYAENP
jgi:hypothetical protein